MLATTYIKLMKRYPRESSRVSYESDLLPVIQSPIPVVTFPREKVQRFNESYGRLLAFAGYVLGKDPRQICELDIERFVMKAAAQAAPEEVQR